MFSILIKEDDSGCLSFYSVVPSKGRLTKCILHHFLIITVGVLFCNSVLPLLATVDKISKSNQYIINSIGVKYKICRNSVNKSRGKWKISIEIGLFINWTSVVHPSLTTVHPTLSWVDVCLVCINYRVWWLYWTSCHPLNVLSDVWLALFLHHLRLWPCRDWRLMKVNQIHWVSLVCVQRCCFFVGFFFVFFHFLVVLLGTGSSGWQSYTS